jgi:hypothetical protein
MSEQLGGTEMDMCIIISFGFFTSMFSFWAVLDCVLKYFGWL